MSQTTIRNPQFVCGMRMVTSCASIKTSDSRRGQPDELEQRTHKRANQVIMAYSAIVFCFGAFLIVGAASSAIPMWEYLSKQEKMSYLYSMFANQVDEFCDSVRMTNCNQALLKYGLDKLKMMPEDHLDTMDPYQRDANTIIWDSMMEGHVMKGHVRQRPVSTSPKPNSYEDDQSFGDFQGAASAKIDEFRVAPPKGFILTLTSGNPQYIYPPKKYQEVPLTGPMVVKVYPDGRPVREPFPILPQDDDLRQYQWSKAKIPNL